MKKFTFFALLLLVFVILVVLVGPSKFKQQSSLKKSSSNSSQDSTIPQGNPQIIVENLDTPWAIAFIDQDKFFFTERRGDVSMFDNGRTHLVAHLTQVKEIGEGGLLGITLHPEFTTNFFVYLYYTYESTSRGSFNRVERYKYENNRLVSDKIIVDAIPGASNHNGGRIKFGPDGFLYITTGDAQNPSQAQNTKNLAGKILRTTDEGDAPADNPFGNKIYSYGHRNPQGIAWNSDGQLFATEHGRSGISSGLDEINRIEKGKNYGWPEIQGDEKRKNMELPIIHSGSDTWAPSGVDIINNKIYFSGLRGEALYVYDFTNKKLFEYFKDVYGRIREVIVGPDKMLYMTTSNHDGRGSPNDRDDKILKLDPTKL